VDTVRRAVDKPLIPEDDEANDDTVGDNNRSTIAALSLTIVSSVVLYVSYIINVVERESGIFSEDTYFLTESMKVKSRGN